MGLLNKNPRAQTCVNDWTVVLDQLQLHTLTLAQLLIVRYNRA